MVEHSPKILAREEEATTTISRSRTIRLQTVRPSDHLPHSPDYSASGTVFSLEIAVTVSPQVIFMYITCVHVCARACVWDERVCTDLDRRDL